jgi:predicted phage terminase large subunit-like protein
MEGWRVERFPAISKDGKACFPELKPLDFLLERKRILTQAGWEAEYQQSPIIVGGGIFPIEKLTTLPTMLDRAEIMRSVRSWDKAGTEGGGKYTSGVLMHKMKNKSYVIEHVVRGRWSALDREEHIKTWARIDSTNSRPGAYEIVVEQEPGSGGKESAENTIRMLAGYKVYADKVTGSKIVRAGPLAAQVQGGNVHLVAGAWQFAFLDELESWPNGVYLDQGDAAAGAFNRLALGPTYNLFGGAFDD